MSEFLSGKRALVTGSTQGIGLAISTALAAAGVKVALHGLGSSEQIAEALAKVAAAGPEKPYFFAGDLRAPSEITRMMDDVDDWGGADIVVNNAGIQQPAPFENVDLKAWDRMIAINLTAPFLIMQRALPQMAARRYGRVVNIASVQGIIGSIHKAPYVAAKHGLVGLSKVAALEYAAVGSAASGGITVNCICPGFTRTEIILPQIAARASELGCDDEAAIASLLSEKQPSLRMSDPSEIGDLTVWLCGAPAHNVTGTAIPIDGGWTTQ